MHPIQKDPPRPQIPTRRNSILNTTEPVNLSPLPPSATLNPKP